MKPSNNAMFNYFLALLVVIIGWAVAIIGTSGIWTLALMTFSIAVADLLFIFGIQADLYRKEEEKCLK